MGLLITAYQEKARELFETIVRNESQSAMATERGLQFLKHVPALTLAYGVVKEALIAVRRRSSWNDLRARLQQLKEADWVLADKTPLRKRTLKKLMRPRFFNPIQIATDCLVFIVTGEQQALHVTGASQGMPLENLDLLT